MASLACLRQSSQTNLSLGKIHIGTPLTQLTDNLKVAILASEYKSGCADIIDSIDVGPPLTKLKDYIKVTLHGRINQSSTSIASHNGINISTPFTKLTDYLGVAI